MLDELGKMELLSRPFCDTVERLFEHGVPVVATVMASRHPLTDALKGAPTTDVMRVTSGNRDRLPDELARRLGTEGPRL